MIETLSYKNKKDNLVEAEITGHAIMRFRERYCVLRTNGVPSNKPELIKLMAALSKHQIADMMRQRFKVAIREKHPKKSRINGYEGGSVYFLDGAIRYVFTDRKLVTIDLTQSSLNKIRIPSATHKYPYAENDIVIVHPIETHGLPICRIHKIATVPILDDTKIEVTNQKISNQWKMETTFMVAAKNLKLMLPCSVCSHNAVVTHSIIVDDKIICLSCVEELEKSV